VPRIPFFIFTIFIKKTQHIPIAIPSAWTCPPKNKIMVCDLLYLFFLQSIKKNQKILVTMRSAFGISLRLLRSRVQQMLPPATPALTPPFYRANAHGA
jgi:hypothetical protein